MTKREKKIQVVKQMLSSCVNSGTSAFSFGNIPRNRFEGAKKSYAYDAKYDEVLALIDSENPRAAFVGMRLSQETGNEDIEEALV